MLTKDALVKKIINGSALTETDADEWGAPYLNKERLGETLHKAWEEYKIAAYKLAMTIKQESEYGEKILINSGWEFK